MPYPFNSINFVSVIFFFFEVTSLDFEWVCFSIACDYYDLKKISFKIIWLIGFRYMFDKNCDWDLCIAKTIYKMFGNCVVAVVF